MLEKLLSLLMTFVLLIMSLFGGNGDITKDEDEDGGYIIADYSYTITDDYLTFENVQYGKNTERNTFDLYIPRTNSKCTMGLILFVHGGGWIMGDKSAYSATAKEYALSHGYACASINYSYLSENADMNRLLNDLNAALEAIKHAGEQVAVTIDKTVMVGHSAGAHLALLYSYSKVADAPIMPAGVVSFAAPTNLTSEEYWTTATDIKDNYYDAVPDESGRSALAYILSNAIGETVETYEDVRTNEDKLLEISPVNYASTAVPTIIIHGTNDITVPFSNAVELNNRLNQVIVSHKLVTVDGADHDLALDLSYVDELADNYLTDVMDLLAAKEAETETETETKAK